MIDIDMCSEKGMRSRNEDSYLAVNCVNGRAEVNMYSNGEPDSYVTEYGSEDFLICAVSDGMGGLKKGEYASYLCVSGILQKLDDLVTADDKEHALRACIEDVSRSICNNTNGESGATLQGFLSYGEKTYLFSVGDSNMLVYRGDSVWRNIKQKATTQNAGREYVTNYMGMDGVDVVIDAIPDYDRIYICSDGLDMVVDDMTGDCKLTAEELCEKSIALGSEDNNTLIIVRND